MDPNTPPKIVFVDSSRGAIMRNTETVTLYHAEPETGTYSHHSHIIHVGDVVYASWSNHAQDEDAPGQRVLMRRTTDKGRTWSESVELFPPLDRVDTASEDGAARRTQCANGFAVVDHVLYAFSEVWDGGGGCRSAGQGRLVRSIEADGAVGPLFWLRRDIPTPKAGMAAYPAGDTAQVEKIMARLRQPDNELTWDFEDLTTRPTADDGHLLCEPTPAWKFRPGTWCKLYRDLGRSNCNYASFSHDDGITWTCPTRTGFPDANSRATAGLLPDGRVYVISNINPAGRDPLAISLSEDGLTFDRVALIRHHAPPMRYAGRWKGSGGFQYPHAAVVGNYLWVMYSVNKEDVQVTYVPLAALAAIEKRSQPTVLGDA